MFFPFTLFYMCMEPSGRLFVVSAPSGAGKTSLVTALIERMNTAYSLERIITYTTKTKRKGEEHGKDYYYVSTQEFEQKIESNFFLEWSGCYGHYYGSPRHDLIKMKKGTSLVLIVDRVGAAQVLQQVEATSIWINTKDIRTLEQRLRGRNTEQEAQIAQRLRIAQKEIEAEQQAPLFDHVVINESFEKSLQKLEMIIVKTIKKQVK